MATDIVTKVTTGGRERVQNATNVYLEAFRTDPTMIYFLASLSEEKRAEYFPRHFHSLLTAAALNGATFEETGDWSCAGVLIPPGRSVDNPFTLIQAGMIPCLWHLGWKGVSKMLFEFEPLSKAGMAKAARKNERCYYLFLIGTSDAGRKKGYASRLIKHYQELAARDQSAIYLEATTAYSRDLYLKLGFELVEEIHLGKGVAAVDGNWCKDGPGFLNWAMIWRLSDNA